MTNNTPDYNDNLYFEEKKMTDCKNCPYTDEYCASGDCKRDNNLTEQWKKGKLPAGCYYIEDAGIYRTVYKSERDDVLEYEHNVYIPEMEDCIIVAPVPSYEEWQKTETQRIDLMTKLNDVNNENHALEIENAELKELLKECKDYLPEYETPMDILAKIDEVLR